MTYELHLYRRNVVERESYDQRGVILWLKVGVEIPSPETLRKWCDELAKQGLEMSFTGHTSIGNFVRAKPK